MNHPDVIGFIFLYEDAAMKAYLSKKAVNFRALSENKAVFATVSGSITSCAPFFVLNIILLSDTHYISNLNNVVKEVPTVIVAKYFKEYKGKPISHFRSKNKSRKVLRGGGVLSSHL